MNLMLSYRVHNIPLSKLTEGETDANTIVDLHEIVLLLLLIHIFLIKLYSDDRALVDHGYRSSTRQYNEIGTSFTNPCCNACNCETDVSTSIYLKRFNTSVWPT
jgi:hypothetical protein